MGQAYRQQFRAWATIPVTQFQEANGHCVFLIRSRQGPAFRCHPNSVEGKRAGLSLPTTPLASRDDRCGRADN
jgi:hypothetical protein